MCSECDKSTQRFFSENPSTNLWASKPIIRLSNPLSHTESWKSTQLHETHASETNPLQNLLCACATHLQTSPLTYLEHGHKKIYIFLSSSLNLHLLPANRIVFGRTSNASKIFVSQLLMPVLGCTCKYCHFRKMMMQKRREKQRKVKSSGRHTEPSKILELTR